MLTFVIIAVCGLAVGAGVTWILLSNRYKTNLLSKVATAEQRANAAEGANAELQTTKEEAARDFDKLREELKSERDGRTKAETQLEEKGRQFEEQKEILEKAEAKLSSTFKALAGDTLESSNKAFLELAEQKFRIILSDAKGDFGKRQEAIDGLIKPLAKSLEQYELHIRSIEKNRETAYGSLEEQLKSLSAAQGQLQKETGNLVTALRRPEVRGRWGEMTLKRVAELAGMAEHCDFVEQVTKDTEAGRIRPDFIVHLPAGRLIIVDSKAPLDAYLSAISAESDEDRNRFFSTHAQQVRGHMKKLSEKAYWDQFDQAPEIVVMFIPGESFFAAAVHQDRSLIEDGIKNRITIATPTTFIALLHAIAYGWRQEQIAKNAIEISTLGKDLYGRMKTLSGYLIDTGKGLEKANAAYNKAVSSMESRIYPAARRFKELGATSDEEIPTIQPVVTTPRMLNAPDVDKHDES